MAQPSVYRGNLAKTATEGDGTRLLDALALVRPDLRIANADFYAGKGNRRFPEHIDTVGTYADVKRSVPYLRACECVQLEGDRTVRGEEVRIRVQMPHQNVGQSRLLQVETSFDAELGGDIRTAARKVAWKEAVLLAALARQAGYSEPQPAPQPRQFYGFC